MQEVKMMSFSVASSAVSPVFFEKYIISFFNLSTKDGVIQQLTSECNERIKLLDESFQRSIDLLLSSYSDYMKSCAPSPQFLPVAINFLIPDKKIQFTDIVLKRTDTLKDLKSV